MFVCPRLMVLFWFSCFPSHVSHNGCDDQFRQYKKRSNKFCPTCSCKLDMKFSFWRAHWSKRGSSCNPYLCVHVRCWACQKPGQTCPKTEAELAPFHQICHFSIFSIYFNVIRKRAFPKAKSPTIHHILYRLHHNIALVRAVGRTTDAGSWYTISLRMSFLLFWA